MKKREFVPDMELSEFDGIRVYCDGEHHYIYVRCMDIWVLSEIIDCLCMKKYEEEVCPCGKGCKPIRCKIVVYNNIKKVTKIVKGKPSRPDDDV